MNAPQALLPALDEIRAHEEEMRDIRHQIHRNPELAYEEHATADLVAERLQRWGYEVHRGLGKTGVVGTLRAGTGTWRLGLRADMDALPIEETSGKPWASKVFGKMHACGHDGHTAMLLSAARHLAATKNFDGILHLVFQPAEEGQAGARAMLEDGFLELFPCDAMFGMHNLPGVPEGQFVAVPGYALASSDTCVIKVKGTGGHGAMPHVAVDVVLAASSLVVALHSIVSRNVNPIHSGVITVGAIHSGEAPNVMPGEAELRLTVRAFRPEVHYNRRYPMLHNHAAETAFSTQVITDWRGAQGMAAKQEPLCGAEDFAFFLEKVPGCYVFLGNGDGPEGGCMTHNAGYDFNDRVLSTGATYWVKLAERFLATP